MRIFAVKQQFKYPCTGYILHSTRTPLFLQFDPGLCFYPEFGVPVWSSEFGERTGSTPGSEFGFGERTWPFTGSAGLEFGERTRSNPGSSGLEKGTGRTLVGSLEVRRKERA